MMKSQASNRTEAEARSRLRRQSVIRMESPDEPTDVNKIVLPAFLHDWREIPSEAVELEEVRKLIQQAVEELPGICC